MPIFAIFGYYFYAFSTLTPVYNLFQPISTNTTHFQPKPLTLVTFNLPYSSLTSCSYTQTPFRTPPHSFTFIYIFSAFLRLFITFFNQFSLILGISITVDHLRPLRLQPSHWFLTLYTHFRPILSVFNLHLAFQRVFNHCQPLSIPATCSDTVPTSVNGFRDQPPIFKPVRPFLTSTPILSWFPVFSTFTTCFNAF
jgi:hypothetical protein